MTVRALNRNAERNCAVRSGPILCLQVQVAKLARGLLYSWSLLCNINTAINLQMFTSSYGNKRFAACDQDSHCGFFLLKSDFLVDLGV